MLKDYAYKEKGSSTCPGWKSSLSDSGHYLEK